MKLSSNGQDVGGAMLFARLEWPLIAKLSPPLSPQTKKVEEEDVPWTGETLLQELASSMDVIESASS